MKKEYLFVYGTLRSSAFTGTSAMLSRHARLVGPAYLRARMYKVSGYPGAVLSDDESDQVRGEIFEVLNPGALFHALDEYEECSDSYPEPREYVRECVTVRTASESCVIVWTYLYNHPDEGLERVASGDYYGPVPWRSGREEHASPSD